MRQSAYRAGHSTKAALLEVFNRVFSATSDKRLTVLVGLDISACDTLDHSIILRRLNVEFGITSTAPSSLHSQWRRQDLAPGGAQSSNVY